jgi:hypothetical protein
VVVSVVHITKGLTQSVVLDDRRVRRISTYLVEGDLDTSPVALAANMGKGFAGSYLLGMGFTFDDANLAKGSSPLAEKDQLIACDQRNVERIFPYIGGKEINNDPQQEHRRYVINFEDFPRERRKTRRRWSELSERWQRRLLRLGIVPLDYPRPVANDWPELLRIIESKVKPQRTIDNRAAYRRYWWRYAERRSQLYLAISTLPQLLAMSRISSHLGICFLPAGRVYSVECNIFAYSTHAPFAVLQSRVHELWARFFSSSMKDDLRYTPKTCFRTFPFPDGFETDPALEAAGEAYYAFRADLMVRRNEGLTKTYNRFHSTKEKAADIVRLRELHAAMDEAVLHAYGWEDLATRARAVFIEQETDEGKAAKTRLDWPDEIKDEVLAKLLALNAERAAAEKAEGLSVGAEEDEDDEELFDNGEAEEGEAA